MLGIPDWSHEIALAAVPKSARLARDFVSLHLVEHRLPQLVDDVRLVVSELATNAVTHAKTPFVVTLSMSGGVVLLVLQDESLTVPIRSERGVMDMSGRGLMIVESLSQEWGINTGLHGSKSVWASFPGGIGASSSAP